MKPGQAFNPKGLFRGTFIPDALMAYPDLSLSAKVLLAYLYRLSHKEGYAYPNQKQLSSVMGITERHIKRLIKELKDNRFIAVKRTPEGYLQHRNNEYVMLWHEAFECENSGLDVPSGGDKNVPLSGDKNVPSYYIDVRDKNIRDKNIYNSIFEQFWNAYPTREGANPKQAAFKAFQARLKEGVEAEKLIESAKAYKDYCDAKVSDRQFVKQAQFWLSPTFRGWEQDWSFIRKKRGWRDE